MEARAIDEVVATANKNAISPNDEEAMGLAIEIASTFVCNADEQEIEDWFATYWDAYIEKAIHCDSRSNKFDGEDTVEFVMRVQDQSAYSGYDYEDDYNSTIVIGEVYAYELEGDKEYRTICALTDLMNEVVSRAVE